MARSMTIMYSSTGGHTEYVVDCLMQWLSTHTKALRIIKQRAELSKPEDLLKSDITLLACGTWNTGNIEGQLNPYMFDFLLNKAKAVQLSGKSFAAIGLGDERYFYTARAIEHLTEFIKTHGGTLLLPALKIVNEPYGQEKKIEQWAEEFLAKIEKLPLKIAKS